MQNIGDRLRKFVYEYPICLLALLVAGGTTLDVLTMGANKATTVVMVLCAIAIGGELLGKFLTHELGGKDG